MRTKNNIILILVVFFIGTCFPSIIYANKAILAIDTVLQVGNQEEARIFYERGLDLHDIGEYQAAEDEFLKAIEIAEKEMDQDLIAESYHYLGRIASWKSKYPQSIQYHKKAKDLYKILNDSKCVAISNNQIALGFDFLGHYDSALVYYRTNIDNRDQVDYNYTILFSYEQVARLYARLYNYKQAYMYLQEGIEYAVITESPLSLAELYLTTGLLLLNNHINKEIALEYLQQAKSLFVELDDCNNIQWTDIFIGDAYHETGDDSLAMYYYNDVAEFAYKENYSALSRANHKIGMVYKDNEQYDSALVYLQKSIDVMCKVCPEISIHNTLIETADVYVKIGNLNMANNNLYRARNIATASNSGFEIVRSYHALAKYYQNIGTNDSTLHYLVLAHERAKKLGLLENIKKTAKSLSDIYYSKNDFKKASDYLKVSNEMNDSLENLEKYKEMAKLEMRFEIEKSEQERKLESQVLQNEISKQKLIRNSSIVGAILSLVIGVLLLRAYRSKRKDNQLLAKQKKEIQEISSQLQESGKRKLDFFTNVSHEIRTPLTLIKSPLERIVDAGVEDDDVNKQLQLAINNANKLKSLVNQILDLQKLDEHQLELDVSDFNIIEFCTEIVSSFEGYCYQSNCILDFEANAAKAIVKFDKERLHSIICNLLSNAVKYNRVGGLVQFKLQVNPDQLMVEIRDTGIGIAKEHLEKLGEKYYQIEKSDFTNEGTGIGFAYVKELVDLMKGKLDISSVLDKGTTVTIHLPCKKTIIQVDTPVKLEIQPKEDVFHQVEAQISDDAENGKARILIVEDNPDLRLFLRDLFALDYHVICAKDGHEGKEMALRDIPDLILSDIMMPGIHGNELCRILKTDINTSHITIILFTAKDTPENIVNGYDCGADDYIVKPFDTELLVRKVKNIIATAENARKQFSFTNIDRPNNGFSEYDRKFLKECMLIIKENLGNSKLTVESLAEDISIHRRTLLRKFKALTGKSPNDLIRHIRMSHAADLIKNQKYRVNEVALMVGYEDSARFSQAFKQFHGKSPSTLK